MRLIDSRGLMGTLRILIFGAVAGVIWSLIPGAVSELLTSSGEALTVLLAGCVTGILIALGLRWPLAEYGRRATLPLGFLVLPSAAFIFGIAVSLVHLAVQSLAGVTYRFAEYSPLEIGLRYGIYSIVPLGPVLLPLSIFTTYLFYRTIALAGRGHQGHACAGK